MSDHGGTSKRRSSDAAGNKADERQTTRVDLISEHVRTNLLLKIKSSFCNTGPPNDDRSLNSAERLTHSGGRAQCSADSVVKDFVLRCVSRGRGSSPGLGEISRQRTKTDAVKSVLDRFTLNSLMSRNRPPTSIYDLSRCHPL